MKFSYFVVTLFLWFLSPMAWAYECNTVSSTGNITVPAISIQRDLPVGSPVGELMVSGTYAGFSCVNTEPKLTYQEIGIKAFGTYVMSIDNRRIYSTNIAGLGYAVYGEVCGFGGIYISGESTGDGNLNNRIGCLVNGIYGQQPISGKMGIQFYKTASTTGSGTVSSRAIGTLILRNNKSDWTSGQGGEANINSFNVTTLACTVNNSAVSVPMGTVERRAFSGAGSWPGDTNTKSFNLSLTCDAGTKVNLQVDGDVQNAQQGVLNIKQEKGSASGIGVQLLYNSAPLALATAKSLSAAASSGAYSIPLEARYYQIGSDVEPGTANAVANFTLTYK